MPKGIPGTRRRSPRVGYDIPGENLAFKGSLGMFLKGGFQEHRRLDRFVIVRKMV